MDEWYDGTSEFNARGNPMVDLLHVAFYLGGGLWRNTPGHFMHYRINQYKLWPAASKPIKGSYVDLHVLNFCWK